MPRRALRGTSWLDAALPGLTCYYVTSLIVVASVTGVGEFLKRPHEPTLNGLADAFARGNAVHYAEIADQGYRYYEGLHYSTVAFSPAFPLAGRCLHWLTGWPIRVALLLIAHSALAAAFVLLHVYVKTGKPARQRANGGQRAALEAADYTLVALGLWPMTFVFRVPYTESLMLLVSILALYAMRQRAHPIIVALIVGFGTACRPVGVALLGPFALYLWERSKERSLNSVPNPCTIDRRASSCPAVPWRFVRDVSLLLPLGCWGIAGFMVFLYWQFGDPLVFATAHETCAQRLDCSYLEQWAYAILLEPIWSVYVPSSPAYWARHLDVPANPLINLPFANPIYFVVSVFLVWLGWKKRWLDAKEVLLAAMLLSIPYFTQGHRNVMLSQGRFAAIAFPVYIVMGQLMARVPGWLVALCCALSATLLAVYAAEFAAWYRVT